jgi:hypothetical protein
LVKVKIPFLYRFKEPLLAGEKTCTSRTRKMGDPGDTFDAFGGEFQINYVWRTSVGVVEKLWKREGTNSEDDFRAVWQQIHQRRGFHPEDLVYVHEISLVDSEHPYPYRPCHHCRKIFVPTLGALTGPPVQTECVECIELSTPHDEGDEAP